MSKYLKNAIAAAMRNTGSFAIEHTAQPGWFLFDFDQTKGITEITWTKDSHICLSWETEEGAEQFLAEADIKNYNISVISSAEL